jgi:hypothetical protein
MREDERSPIMVKCHAAVALVLAMFADVLAQDVLPPANPSPFTVGSGVLDPSAVKPGVWYKRSPLPDAPKNPRMGYEAAPAYDPYAKVVLRWGGHNQGGGGEQNAEMWVYNPRANTFTLMEPNYSPPGACCNRDNVFDIANRRYIRFPSWSASHGWQWRREVYQNQSSAWAYDLQTNQWRNMRPWPEPRVGPLRGAAYDTDNQVVVVAQGENVKWGTAVYDLYTNTWTMMNAKNEPPERNTFGFAYDPVGRQFVSFGSQSGSDPRTWLYDLRRNEWRGLELHPHPPALRNGAVMAYDPYGKIMLCVVMTWKQGVDPEDKTPARVPDRLETWAFDPAKLTWTQVETKGEPDVSGVRARLMVYDPDLNLFILESRTNREQGIWVFRYAERTPPKNAPPAAPTDLSVLSLLRPRPGPDSRTGLYPSVRLSWTPSTSPDVAGYFIYRGEGERPWLVDYARVERVDGSARNQFVDERAQSGKAYFYYLTAFDKAGREGPPSLKVRTQPPVVVDVTVCVLAPRQVELTWRSPADDVIGYNLFRAPVTAFSTDQVPSIRDKHKLTTAVAVPFLGTWRLGEFAQINERPVVETTFVDSSVDLSRPPSPPTSAPAQNVDLKGKAYPWAVYAYRLTAINRLGAESGPSPYYLTVPGPVSDLKSRERPGETDLKWSPNPEKELQGYRVYRMESRGSADNGFSAPITLLTPEVLKGTTFTDRIPNGPEDDAKRYYVVAVDALGQEGIVGSPTWGAREYARYYSGFLGEWHQ